ncbi:MAG: dynamin family protein, partial [Sciscionella sp.]
LRVLVVGEAKRGKSTLVNALLRRDVLPTGVTPLTAVPTTVRYGTPDRVLVDYRNGTRDVFSVDRLDELVTERGNPGNRLGLRRVVVALDSALLQRGIELVDTPGTGSIHEANTSETESALADMDAAIFVLTVDPPISASERSLLQRVSRASIATFLLLNKADRMDHIERQEALEFTRTAVRKATGTCYPVYLCSTRQALDGAKGASGEIGLREFRNAFEDYLAEGRSVGLLDAAANHAAELVGLLLDEQRLTLRTMELREEAATERVEQFSAKLGALSKHHRDAGDRVRGEAARLLAELNAAAEAITVRARGELTRRVRADLADLAETGSPRDIATQGQDWIEHTVVPHVDAWRQRRATLLQDRLDELEKRLRVDPDGRLAELRPAARELLGIELTAPPAQAGLFVAKSFHYVSSAEPDQAATIRDRLPGAYGRRKALDHVVERVDARTRQHVGRARADLQYRLAETSRAFTAALAARYGDYTERLRGAISAATDSSATTVEEQTSKRGQLAGRAALLAELRSALDPTPRATDARKPS